ncbi:MAG: cation:proton antiporter, partial [Bacteriovoracia bacterium]
VGSLLIGSILGIILSYWEQQEKNESEMLLGVISAILLGQTIAIYLGLESLLISLALGFALVNSSPSGMAIHEHMKHTGLSIYALFFVLAGAHLHLQEQIETIGVLGLGYILARILGMQISSWFAGKITKENPKVSKFMGMSVLSHAGAALAIVIKFSDPNIFAGKQSMLEGLFRNHWTHCP